MVLYILTSIWVLLQQTLAEHFLTCFIHFFTASIHLYDGGGGGINGHGTSGFGQPGGSGRVGSLSVGEKDIQLHQAEVRCPWKLPGRCQKLWRLGLPSGRKPNCKLN